MRIFSNRKLPTIITDILHQQPELEIIEFTEERSLSQEELIEYCKDVDGYLNFGHSHLNRHFMEQCPRLKVISLFSVGYDHVDMEAAKGFGIAIGHTPDVLSKATSDTAFMLMMAVSRNAFHAHQHIQDGAWGFFRPFTDLGTDLHGKTLGVFGLGNIGQEMAKKCIGAFNMKVIYHNRSQNKHAEDTLGATYVSFEELLRQSDVLSLHANLSEENTGKFDAAVFAQMKPTSIFINTARGAMHNEKDLTAALEQGHIWGAGLDVTNPEPMQADNALLEMPNVCITPHIGSATIETRNAMAQLAANNLLATLKGAEMPAQVS